MTRWKKTEELTFRDVMGETIMGNEPGDILVRYGQGITPDQRETLCYRGVEWVCVQGIDPNQMNTHKPMVSPIQLDEFLKEVNDLYDQIMEEGRVDCETAEQLGKEIAKEVIDNFSEIIIPSLTQLKEMDQYTFTHQINVSIIATSISMRLFPNDKDRIRDIALAGLLHDAGKTMVPQEILMNTEQLTEREFSIVKQHPILGCSILEESGIHRKEILDPILYHHERWNGKGYNTGRSGKEIPLVSRIISISDVYDALTSDRPYKCAWPPSEATQYIVRESSHMFDPELVNLFLRIFGLHSPGSKVLLSSGEEAIVIGNRYGYIAHPLVSVIRDGTPFELDLSTEKKVRIQKPLYAKALS